MKRMAVIALCLLLLAPAAFAQGFEPSSLPLIEGIDVSQYQREIDHEQVYQSGIRMMYIRASLGFTYEDPQAARNANGAAKAGLEYGFYHFCTASTTEEAVRQARFFVEIISRYAYDMRPVLELSPTRGLNRSEFTDVAIAFQQEVERLTGYRPAVYCSASTARDRFDGRMADYPLWVADYGAELPEGNDTWKTWAGFQYESEGHVAGVEGRVDRDRFTAELRLAEGPTPTPAPTVRPTPSPTALTRAYVVQRGDTLFIIARRFDTSVEALARLNVLADPDRIYPGQVLYLG